MNSKTLIVNADDFGLSRAVNQGVLTGHERGIVTSASLMVRWPAATEAVALSRAAPRLSIGLHIDLGEWICRGGTWSCLYEVVPLTQREAVEQEILRQLDQFRELTGRNPTHLDSHQHVHREEPARKILMALAAELEVPLRHFAPRVAYCGAFYGQTAKGETVPDAVSPTALRKVLEQIPVGVTELACHPAAGDDLKTMYRRERLEELRTLCAPEVRAVLAPLGIRLCSFHELTAASASDLAPTPTPSEQIG